MSISETVAQATSLVGGARVLVYAPWVRLEAGEVVVAVDAVATARTLLDGCLVQATDRLIATDAVHALGWASVKDYLTHVTGGHQGSGVVAAGSGDRHAAAIWTALIARDGHCAFPTCTRPPLACDAHHVEHWADGGATSVDNMVMLCRRHHAIVHHTPWVVEIDPDTRLPFWRPPPRLRVADLQGKVAYHPARGPGSGRGRDPGRAA